MTDKPKPRFQFSLRWLFVIVTATALCALVFRLSGIVETIGVIVSLLLCAICLNLPRFPHHRWAQGGLLVTATSIVWMVGVDYSLFVEGCDYCGSHWDAGEYRILRQPIWSRRGGDHSPCLRLIAEDLGAPCRHNYQRWHRCRLWGLFKPGPPFINGTCCLTEGEWYEGDLRAHVRSLGTHDPSQGEQFQRALREQDYVYLKKFVSEVRSMEAEYATRQ